MHVLRSAPAPPLSLSLSLSPSLSLHTHIHTQTHTHTELTPCGHNPALELPALDPTFTRLKTSKAITENQTVRVE